MHLTTLTKHATGTPLTQAERRQRVEAARRRWAAVGVGGVAGGVAGAFHHVVRDRAASLAAAEQIGVRTSATLHATEQAINTRAAQHRARILETIKEQRASVGTYRNPTQVYDFEINRLTRQLQREQTLLNRMHAAAEQIAADRTRGTDDLPVGGMTEEELDAFLSGRRPPQSPAQAPTPEEVAARAKSARIDRQIVDSTAKIKGLQNRIQGFRNLRSRAPNLIARRGSLRGRDSKPPFKVSAASVRQYRRGETSPQIRRREAGLKREIGEVQQARLSRFEEALPRHHENARVRITRQAEAAIHDALASGEITSRVLRRAGRGAILGAGIGMTLAGLGVLAHHVVNARARARRARLVAKIADRGGLDALAKAQSLSDRAAAALAATYRRWIDRLLGRGQGDLNFADGFTGALAPAITQAYADGLTNPPIDTDGSDPRHRIDIDFDVLNPAVRRHMAEYALDRIAEISTAQREAIRTALMQNSVLQGIGPYDVARIIRQSIGLTSYQQAQVQAFRSQLVALDPRALGRQLRDRRFDATLRRAIDTGTPLADDQVNAMEDAYHRRFLALRAQTIARTEAIRATSYGALARAQEVLDLHPELDVIKIWHATEDERTRDTHRNLDGKMVEGMLTNFVTSKNNLIRFPFDERAPAEEVVNCRCYIEWRFVPKRGSVMPAQFVAEAV